MLLCMTYENRFAALNRMAKNNKIHINAWSHTESNRQRDLS